MDVANRTSEKAHRPAQIRIKIVSYLNAIKMAGFLFIILGIICTLHYLLYATLVRFGVVSNPGLKRVLFWLLMVLGLSFFPAAILMRTFPGVPSNLLYMTAAFWLGLFIYLLLATLLSWGVFGLGKLAGITLNIRLVLIACWVFAAAVAIQGTWRARYPTLKPIDITLKDLPDAWQGKTVIQLSDVHLGAVQGPEFLKRVTTLVNSVHPELILITGDLFDGVSGGNLADFIEPLNRLESARGIFFATGNHEGYLGLKAPLNILTRTKITVLDNEVADINGLQIIGIPFPEHNRKNNARNVFEDSATYSAGKPSILMYHTPTNIGEQFSDRENQQTNTYWRPDTSMRFVKNAGVDLQLSGHTHRGQLFPFTLLTRYIFKGYDYGLHRDGDFQIYITSGVGTWGPPMRVACPPEIPVFRLNRS